MAEALERIADEANSAGVDPRQLADQVEGEGDRIWSSCSEEESDVAQVLERVAESQSSVASQVLKGSQAAEPISEEVVRAAETRLVAALVEKGVLPAFRDAINQRIADSFDPVLRVTHAPGLSERYDASFEISTAATADLNSLLEQTRGGSFGISGPRGAGKTTLIRSFCRSEPYNEKLAVMVSAPVDYEGREFVLHLFARLCQEVIAAERERGSYSSFRSSGSPFQSSRQRRKWRPDLVRVIGLCALVAGIAVIVSAAVGWHPRIGWGWIAGFALVAAGAVLLAIWWRPRAVREVDVWDGSLEDTAERLLQQIKFQQSFSSGWSGSLNLPAGASVGVEQGQTWAERQQSFPDIVAEFKRFTLRVSSEYRIVVIGIDEMDKIDSEQDAHIFLNDIKGIFGIEGCFYLVSISEDAMSSFERRGLPFRDAFDSSFDDVVPVRFLNLAEAHQLLNRRVVGLSVPFVSLSYCASGGLPRDLVRVCRELVVTGQTRADEGRHVAELCRALLQEELRRKTDAIAIAARTIAVEPQLSDFIRWLKQLRSAGVTSAELLECCRNYPTTLRAPGRADEDKRESDDRVKLRRLGSELVGFTYYAATLLDFFDHTIDRQRLEEGDHSDNEQRRLDTLAEARQTFTINSAIAWEHITAFRSAWQKPLLPFPHSAQPAPSTQPQQPISG